MKNYTNQNTIKTQFHKKIIFYNRPMLNTELVRINGVIFYMELCN